MVIGYTSGVFDLFHVGHVNLLRNAKSMCDKLIVGVTTDELVSYKNKRPVIPYSERIEVVKACRYVDVAIAQYDMNKLDMISKLKANIMFVGDDWYRSDSWEKYELELKSLDCEICYFPYTQGVSSTLINRELDKIRKEGV